MHKLNHIDDDIGANELRKVIEALIEQVLSEKPQLKLDPKQKKALVDNMLKVLSPNPEKTFKREDILQPEFAKKLTLCVMAAITLDNNNHLKDAIKNIFDAKKLDLNKIMGMKPKEFKDFMEKNFTPQELKALQDALKNSTDKLFKDMEKNFNIRPEPQASKKLSDDLYTNLFGLLNSAVEGTMAVPVTCYVGNGLGFNDWNPYNGDAPIDMQNSVKDTAFGDALGLNAITLEHYKAIPDTITSEYYDEAVYKSGQKPGMPTPTLNHS